MKNVLFFLIFEWLRAGEGGVVVGWAVFEYSKRKTPESEREGLNKAPAASSSPSTLNTGSGKLGNTTNLVTTDFFGF